MAGTPDKPNPRPRRRNRSARTRPGEHVAVLLRRVMGYLKPAPGETVADCTLGFGRHAMEFLRHTAPDGRLIGLDVDAAELDRTRQRLDAFARRLSLHRRNFAELPDVLAGEAPGGVDILFADLGVSSMQIDDPARGIGYAHDGPLDMRLDDRLPRTAADVLATIPPAELAAALAELSDEPAAETIAQWIARQRQVRPLETVNDLAALVLAAKGFSLRQRIKPWEVPGGLHPAARTFQTLRLLVNDELASLRRLLAAAPACLKPGGRIGVISFHGGEDRLVRESLAASRDAGTYDLVATVAVRPTDQEVRANPRSASARFRWARKSS